MSKSTKIFHEVEEQLDVLMRQAALACADLDRLQGTARPKYTRAYWRSAVLQRGGVTASQVEELNREWERAPGLFSESGAYRYDIRELLSGRGAYGTYWGSPGADLPLTSGAKLDKVATETARCGHSPWSVIALAIGDCPDSAFGELGGVEKFERDAAAVRDRRDQALEALHAVPAMFMYGLAIQREVALDPKENLVERLIADWRNTAPRPPARERVAFGVTLLKRA